MMRIDVTACFHSDGLGSRFLEAMALLAHIAGVSPEATALHIHTGRSAELAAAICASLSPRLGGQMDAQMDAFVRKAALYQPPASLEQIRCTVYRALARHGGAAPRGEPAPVFIPGEAAAMEVLARLIRFTTALGYPPRVVARILHAGRFGDLVQALWLDNRLRTCAANVQELSELAAIAPVFVLPERFISDPESLLRRVERIAGR